MNSACIYIECPITGMILGVSRKNNPNAWGLPGGKLERWESEEEAAERELFEETGIRLWLTRKENGKVIPNFREVFRRDGSVTFSIDISDYYYSVPRAATETGRVAWVTVEQLLAGPFGDYNRALLTKIGRIK